MELKEVVERCNNILIASVDLNFSGQNKQALQTAISHLETLQKVEEMGGVARKEILTVGKSIGDRLIDDYAKGFNDALKLKDIELAGRLIKYYNCDNPNCGKGAICNYCALRKDLMGI